MPLSERCAIFLKAADLLVSDKYRYKMMAATMLGQGKTTWQAEIDAIAELADFWRFNCLFAQELYSQQPLHNSAGTWNRLEYRSLDGFVVAISPFNFTAIGGNLVSAPVLMGNVVIWKPSSHSIYSNALIYEILLEAGLPPNVIQFVPGSSELYQIALRNPRLAGIHFTGSTSSFCSIWQTVSKHLPKYHNIPRIVGETGGKNMHFVHSSADVTNVVNQTIRSAFEYQGQKCSACSRIYVPESLWPSVRESLVEQVSKLRMGPADDMTSFLSAVIHKSSFDKCLSYLNSLSSDTQVVVGGSGDDKEGYYVQPTILLTKDPHSATMKEEIFGPILTVFVYPDHQYEKYLEIASDTSPYALTASIFASDRQAIQTALHLLRHAAGNIYINDKSTGAVVAQQPFGGSRHSGTNDKAGSQLNLTRWTSVRSIKENFIPLTNWSYPSCQI
jgi:1-pyrroline-5-carboxylate dehydrogenase